MNWDAYRDFLLARLPNARSASGGKLINCRCRECQDSMDPRSAHFYISIPKNDSEPALYYCHKCHCGGIVTYRKLIEWDVYDKDLAASLVDYNIHVLSNPKNAKYCDRLTYHILNTFVTVDDKTEYKRRYICDRLGVNLSYKELLDLKIVLNLKDVIKENHIQKLTRDNNIINDLDREFIGFLSIDNAFLNMRRTVGEGIVYKTIDQRYVNYKLMDKLDTSERFYTVPTSVDLCRPQRVKLHIAEGPFDILSIYLNIRNKEEGIYTSVGGSNYLNLILYFLIDVKLPFIELHLYPDNDDYGSMKRLNYIVAKLPDPTIPVYVHRNESPGQKDFGVPPKDIIEKIYKIR